MEKLDNPVWYSLTEKHQNFALEYGEEVKFYQPDYCPFGGFIQLDKTLTAVEKYAALLDSFYVVGDKPLFGDTLKIKKELVCNQMILDRPVEQKINEEIIELQEKHRQDLLELVNLVQPGYFKNKTAQLGNYFGIYKDGMLVAVTGERMKMNDYTEVSAIVTHPKYTGQGYAKQLITHTVNNLFSGNSIPYLHVAETNLGAIQLYEKLGFRTRRKISFWNLGK